jgi:small subunit ribosomal protein S4
MSRYRGPRRKVVRRLGVALDGLTRKAAGDRAFPPGQHGVSGARRKLSQYGVRLREKQKLRYYYGITETQLRRYYERARRQDGPTGANLLALLERRLDNVVFRLGLAPTIPGARQLVSHGHIAVNGARVTYPAYEVKRSDVVSAHERSRTHQSIVGGATNGPTLALPSYLTRADDHLGGSVSGMPSRQDVPLDINESLVVEFYAR